MSKAEQDAFEEKIRRQIEAYHESALVYAAVKLGLPDKMGTRSWTVKQLAAELGLSAPHLVRLRDVRIRQHGRVSVAMRL